MAVADRDPGRRRHPVRRDHLLRPAAQGRAGQAPRRRRQRRPVEPRISDQFANGVGAGVDEDAEQAELELGEDAPAASSDLGRRPSDDFDKIVTIYVAARAGEKLRGPDIVVAAEKAGLTYGHMNVFHRLVEGHPERGPVFSVANIMKPGSFDMAAIHGWKRRRSRSS